MTNYNAGSPDRLGLEWPATRQRWDPLGATVAPAAIVTARSTAAFTQIRAFLRLGAVEVGADPGTQIVACDLYNVPVNTISAPNPSLLRSFGTTLVSNLVPANFVGAWITFTAASAFSFAVGTQYMIVLRKTNPNSGIEWAALDCTSTVGYEQVRTPDHAAVEIALDPTTFLPIRRVYPGTDTGARALGFVTAANVYLVDSQVYSLTVPTVVDATDTVIVQAFPSSTAAIGQVTIVLRNDGISRAADALAISFPDDPTIAPVPFPLDALPDHADGRWYRTQVELPTPLPAGSAHRVQLASVSANPRSWTVAGLTTGAPGDTTLSVRTFQGTGAMTDLGYDALVTEDALLAAPTSLTFSVKTIDTSRGLSHCVTPFVYMPQLNWPTTSAIETKLARYEIQRNDDGTWRDVATITRGDGLIVPPGGPTHFVDYEALRNTPVSYRIRMVTTAGVLSAWRTAGPITLPSEETDVLLFSNWKPDTYWAGKDEGGYTWNVVDGGRLQSRMLYARDRQFGVREFVNRGDQFDRSLILAVADPDMPRIPDQTLAGLPHYAAPGRVVFDPLLAIAHARDVPYVCFLDAFGRRWFTAPTVTGLHKDEPFKQYRADAGFIEVTDTPAPVTLDTLPPFAVTGIGWDSDNWSPGTGDGSWST